LISPPSSLRGGKETGTTKRREAFVEKNRFEHCEWRKKTEVGKEEIDPRFIEEEMGISTLREALDIIKEKGTA